MPNPPQLLEVTCNDRDASVTWQPMGDNRAPVLGYLIQYNTSFTPDTWENAFESVPATSTQFNVSDLFVYGSLSYIVPTFSLFSSRDLLIERIVTER